MAATREALSCLKQRLRDEMGALFYYTICFFASDTFIYTHEFTLFLVNIHRNPSPVLLVGPGPRLDVRTAVIGFRDYPAHVINQRRTMSVGGRAVEGKPWLKEEGEGQHIVS